MLLSTDVDVHISVRGKTVEVDVQVGGTTAKVREAGVSELTAAELTGGAEVRLLGKLTEAASSAGDLGTEQRHKLLHQPQHLVHIRALGPAVERQTRGLKMRVR